MLFVDVRVVRFLVIMFWDMYLGVDSWFLILRCYICEEFMNIDRFWNMEEMSVWVELWYRSKILDGYWRVEVEVVGGYWLGGDEIMKIGIKLFGYVDDGLLVM